MTVFTSLRTAGSTVVQPAPRKITPPAVETKVDNKQVLVLAGPTEHPMCWQAELKGNFDREDIKLLRPKTPAQCEVMLETKTIEAIVVLNTGPTTVDSVKKLRKRFPKTVMIGVSNDTTTRQVMQHAGCDHGCNTTQLSAKLSALIK